MNNKVIIGIVVIAIVLLGVFLFAGKNNTTNTPSQQQEQTTKTPEETAGKTEKNAVTIKGFAFSPETITVKKGTTITWTNEDAAGHTATADDGTFDTGLITKGESGSVTFDTVGTFSYHCTPHPNMKGTVVVTE
ncbi:MAG: cupredoxin family copper-binding protein [Candidatus Levybacteria bacterium]|nr:cupredoxin family copper-binding protein [Candidatus Levybacteria bacterium]